MATTSSAQLVGKLGSSTAFAKTASRLPGRAISAKLAQPVTFVTGNAKKLEEVKSIIGGKIPFKSIKLDCKFCFQRMWNQRRR
jgi:hypothetical protein